MAQILLLDVDGVLIAGRPHDGKAWHTDLQRDLGISGDQLQSVFFKPHWNSIILGHAKLRDRLNACWPEMQTDASVSDFIAYWFSQDARVDQTVLRDVQTLRAAGVQVHLATNQEHERASYIWNDLHLRDHVDGILYSAQFGAQKPNPDFYDACENTLKIAPTDITFVDDTHANVLAAQSRGWTAYHWTHGIRLVDIVSP